MSKTAKAFIVPEGAPNQTVYSKYRLEGTWKNPETEVENTWTFNVNSDVAVRRFWSKGADKTPPEANLVGTYSYVEQFSEFDTFSGSIGKGRFYLRTGRGVVFKGEIVGGPDRGLSFVGSGGWVIS